MKFSILIAHYNNWNYFQECYESIIHQTHTNFEIVIVDDYSTDDSYFKLKQLATIDSKIKLFQNTENKKVGYTKRRCVEEAEGEICFFLDPDDFISNTTLEEIIDAYKFNDNAIATYSKIKLINVKSEIIGDFRHSKKFKNGDVKFFNILFEVAHLFSFKRDVYLKTSGINPSLSSSVDQDLYMKLYEQGDFYFIDKVQYYYRLHEKGVSQDKSKKEVLNLNWHRVLLDTCKRRGIIKLYGKPVESIDNLPRFIFKNENTFFKKIRRKFQ